jgi:cytochrome c peroxidase
VSGARWGLVRGAVLITGLVLALAACREAAPRLPDAVHFLEWPPARGPVEPPADPEAAIELGRALFYDPALSVDGQRSCATCHRPSRAFAGDRLRGADGRTRDVPPLVGVARRSRFGWDGRVETLERMCLHAFGDPSGLGSSLQPVLRQVTREPELRALFERAFGWGPDPRQPGTQERLLGDVGRALASFVAQLQSGAGRFDAAARDLGAAPLGVDALRGWRLFNGAAGCARCHSGALFSDDRLRGIGLPDLQPRPEDPDDPLLRLEQGVVDHSLPAVRTPSLRDVARTAPYMHDGRFSTLEEVLRFYSESAGVDSGGDGEVPLRPLGLSERAIADLEAFLSTLDSAPTESKWLSAP